MGPVDLHQLRSLDCVSSPYGPVKDTPCSLAIRTSSWAANSSAEACTGFCLVTASSVVITEPFPLNIIQRIRPETPLNPVPMTEILELASATAQLLTAGVVLYRTIGVHRARRMHSPHPIRRWFSTRRPSSRIQS